MSIILPLLSGLISILATLSILHSDFGSRFLDVPNERSLHELPIPRTGGLAILASVFLILFPLIGKLPGLLTILEGAVVVAIVSLIDDCRSLPATFRLTIHIAVTCFLLFGGISLPFGKFGLILTVPVVVWMINLYNFMDGMDGFAGGMAFVGFGFLGLTGWLTGQEVYALVCWVVSAAAFGFLAFNFPPARIFMGDVGSATLGFLAAALSVQGVRLGVFDLWLPLLVFSPFIVDATVTLLRRLVQGEKIFEAHRCHYYQRLVQLGWGHKKTVLVAYGLMTTAGLSALSLRHASGVIVTIFLLLWTGIYFSLMTWVHRLERAHATHRAAT